MSAPTLVSDPDDPDPQVVAQAARTLAAGGLVIVPTETVYGLACRADDETALRRLIEVKRRSPEKALALILPSAGKLPSVALVTPAAQRLAEAFMPGAITLVLRRQPSVSPLVTGGRETVGVRVPDLPVALAILAACDFPVVATSANLAGEPAATKIADLPEALRDAMDLIVDAGPCRGGQASTVVDVTVEPPAILREGPIAEEDIRSVL